MTECLDDDYIRLYCKCPTTECEKRGDKFFWQHHGCGGDIYVGSDAYLKCGNNHSKYIRNWRFKCHHNTDFQNVDLMIWFEAMSTFGQSLSKSTGWEAEKCAQWLSRAILNSTKEG